MDPMKRLLLEVSYESIENGKISEKSPPATLLTAYKLQRVSRLPPLRTAAQAVMLAV